MRTSASTKKISVLPRRSAYENSVAEFVRFMAKAGYHLMDITDLNRSPKHGVLWLCELAFLRDRSQSRQLALPLYLRLVGQWYHFLNATQEARLLRVIGLPSPSDIRTTSRLSPPDTATVGVTSYSFVCRMLDPQDRKIARPLQ